MANLDLKLTTRNALVYLKKFSEKYLEEFLMIMMGLLILIAIFPRFDLTYTHGLDGSLSWVFNQIYNSGFELGRNIIFPHGPLAFFMYPLQENLYLALFITTILQLVLVFNIFQLQKNETRNIRWLVAPMISFILLNILSFNLVILAIIISSYLLYNENQKNGFYKYLAFFLAVFAFYVKAYVAILSGIITVSFLIVWFVKQRKIYHTLLDGSFLLLVFLLFWVSIYGTFTGIVQYFIGMINLSMNNSSAASFYPENFWACLSIFLIITFLISFVQKSPKGYYFGFLLTLSLFAGWKHGMSREDIHHAMEFLIYVILVFFLFLVYVRKNIPYNLLLVSIAILLFAANLKNVVRFQPYTVEIISVNNLTDFITNFPTLKEEANRTIEENISFNKIPAAIVQKIGNATVDVYPWDYSVIPANNFAWQPRPQIQSHTTFTPWLDKKNADHFNSSLAAEYLIWHLYTSSQTGIQKTFESIDGRYLLNDEPQTMVQILRNYDLIYKDSSYLIYKRKPIPAAISEKLSEPFKIKWDQWIPVPKSNHAISRIKVGIKDSFIGKLKDFFYKGNYYYVYYKLSDGSIYKNRIVPKTAIEGLWINPYIVAPGNNFIEPEVSEIMFKCHNSNLSKDEITVTWEQITFNSPVAPDSLNYPNKFFGKDSLPVNNQLVLTTNNFEFYNEAWANIVPENMVENAYTGLYSCTLQPNSFSAMYVCKLDTFRNKELFISSNCWVKSRPGADVLMVMTVENKDNMLVKNGVNIKSQIINMNEWNNISCFQKYNAVNSGDVLKVFLVNIGKTPILYDDYSVQIKEQIPDNLGTFYNF